MKHPSCPLLLPAAAFLNTLCDICVTLTNSPFQVSVLSRTGVGGFALVQDSRTPAKPGDKAWPSEPLETHCPKNTLFRKDSKTSR